MLPYATRHLKRSRPRFRVGIRLALFRRVILSVGHSPQPNPKGRCKASGSTAKKFDKLRMTRAASDGRVVLARQSRARVGGKIPSPSAHTATSPKGRGYIVFLYSSIGEDIILPTPHASLESVAARGIFKIQHPLKIRFSFP